MSPSASPAPGTGPVMGASAPAPTGYYGQQAPQPAQHSQYQPVPAPAASQGYPGHHVAAAPAAQSGPKANEMVYGTPVSGPPPHLMPYSAQAQGQSAVPGGPSHSAHAPPQPHGYGAPPAPAQQQYQYQQSYPAAPQYQPAAASAPSHNPAYNPAYNAYGAAQPPGAPQQHQQQQQYAPQPAQPAYGAYPSLPSLGQQPAPQAAPQPGYQYNNSAYNTVPGQQQQQQQQHQQQGITQMQPHQAPQPMNPAELHAKVSTQKNCVFVVGTSVCHGKPRGPLARCEGKIAQRTLLCAILDDAAL
jgi:hypothetical protein